MLDRAEQKRERIASGLIKVDDMMIRCRSGTTAFSEPDEMHQVYVSSETYMMTVRAALMGWDGLIQADLNDNERYGRAGEAT